MRLGSTILTKVSFSTEETVEDHCEIGEEWMGEFSTITERYR